MSKRVFLIVLDSLGVGAMPDSENFGDYNVNTLRSISKSPFFKAETLKKLGMFNIDGVDFLENADDVIGAHGRFSELSQGKDTTIGHWEISGLVSKKPLPTFPDGFPKEFIDKFSTRVNRNVLCNKPYSGTKVIADYGEEHIKTGGLIVYTSADSVFQIAAHEEVVPVETLYEYCKIARELLTGEYGVGRVIARPFIGTNGDFIRTSNRHDFSLEPPSDTMLDIISGSGLDTIAVGKINDIFAGRGITEYKYSINNSDGMRVTRDYLEKEFNGLCFVNLVDFDMVYGHRRDVNGYAKALTEFDVWLGGIIDLLKNDDILMITADHGCDPAYDKTTDHTREYIPFIAYGKHIKNINLHTRYGFCDIGETICEYLNVDNNLSGKSFLGDIYE